MNATCTAGTICSDYHFYALKSFEYKNNRDSLTGESFL